MAPSTASVCESIRCTRTASYNVEANTLFSKANLDADVLRTDAPDLAKLLRAERPVARRLVVVYQPVVTVKLCCRYAVVVRIYNLKKEAFEKWCVCVCVCV